MTTTARAAAAGKAVGEKKLSAVGHCLLCQDDSPLISSALGMCAACVKEGASGVLALERHAASRAPFGLPSAPPRSATGKRCKLCVNECELAEGDRGYCGIRSNQGGRLVGASSASARVSWYHDPLPTNCVASWVCPAQTDAGYPSFTRTRGPEYGYSNLAVFYEACSFNCLFCQNWHFRESGPRSGGHRAEELAEAVDLRTACICYFGGDPGPQLPHALRASRLARKKAEGRILRICWETNGAMNPRLLDQMAELSLESGGCIKFDLKAWDESLHIALTGVSNRRTLENFARVAALIPRRLEPPLLIASTLLVPGYIGADEVAALAQFIAGLNPTVPYSLLGFHPQFYMHDLPRTSWIHAERCEAAARAAGLERVRIGNLQLLGGEYT